METNLKLFATGLNEPEVPAKPTESQKSQQIALIIEAMEDSKQHDYGVTTLRMIEICGPASYRQRISDARKHFHRQGLDIVCRKSSQWNNYFLEPYQVK